MENILLINRLGIGDVVLTTPLAELIKERLNCRLGMVVSAKATDIIENHPYIDDVFGYHVPSREEMLHQIRCKNYTNAIIVDERLSSTLMAIQAGCKLLNIGFEITIDKKQYFRRKQRALRASLDYSYYIRCIDSEAEIKYLQPRVGKPDKQSETKIKSWYKAHKFDCNPLVLIVPRGVSANKNWPVELLAELNASLNCQNVIPVYLGSKQDEAFVGAIDGNLINTAGYFSLREIALLARYATVSVTPCTGTMHIIATAGTPLIALYGPTNPERWAPEHAVVLQAKESMEDISVQMVMDALQPHI
ncbi:heptosyltransferase-2 [Hydrogenispora ethanolica]|uniref:Heptosyltransferase-2 n=1 Tax=Hydrogenispora ethanolica TaxID=1082276 RepID=A0A4R1RGB6_HYDET|nr:glycosyltransferase family 9 protein [Hydrogenispora ethanolica]TCL64740.1 heptosyltransferase-2 [Hydrogenispora ethanolica]